MPSSSCAFSSASWIWLTQGSSIGVEKIAATFSFSCATVAPGRLAANGARGGDAAQKLAAIELRIRRVQTLDC